jgi:hypothetical protein
MPSVPGFTASRNAPLFHNGPWPPGTGIPFQMPGFPAILLGSTTWTADTHHLASQIPLHNTRWGAAAQHLSRPVPPQERASFDFTSRAPDIIGPATWAWQMVSDPSEPFGPQAAAQVLVGALTSQCQAIRDQITAIRRDLAALKMEKDSLNPRDSHELVRIKKILKEMAKLNEDTVDLQHEAAWPAARYEPHPYDRAHDR